MTRAIIGIFCVCCLLTGCSMVMHSEFPNEELKTKNYTNSWVGKEFIKFIKDHPNIDRMNQIDDGKGGVVYEVSFKSLIPYKTWYEYGEPHTNYYAIFKATYFVGKDGIINDIKFRTTFPVGMSERAWYPHERKVAAPMRNKTTKNNKSNNKQK